MWKPKDGAEQGEHLCATSSGWQPFRDKNSKEQSHTRLNQIALIFKQLIIYWGAFFQGPEIACASMN